MSAIPVLLSLGVKKSQYWKLHQARRGHPSQHVNQTDEGWCKAEKGDLGRGDNSGGLWFLFVFSVSEDTKIGPRAVVLDLLNAVAL